MNVECVSRLYELTKLRHFFNFPNLTKLMKLNYRKRCFTSFVETETFLRLDFARVFELLSSSDLQVTSEIEVLDAADGWIRHNTEERSKHAKDLLLQVRFPLLSHSALKYVLSRYTSFQKLQEYRSIIHEILNHKENSLQNSTNYFTNRYCSQNFFSLFICGGKFNDEIYEIDQENLKCVKEPVSTSGYRWYDKSVCLKGEVYIFDNLRSTGKIEKFSPVSKTCEQVANLNDRKRSFCLCALNGRIYVIGGHTDEDGTTDTCTEFDPNDYTWRERARMIEARKEHAGVVFEGRIVVSGGIQHVDEEAFGEDNETNNYYDDHDEKATRTAEQYDHVINSWSKFPSMINTRCHHQSVVVKNKLFVFGGGTFTSEVYDSNCKKFVALKQPGSLYTELFQCPCSAVIIGNDILVFGEQSSVVLCYDTERNVWCEKSCEITK